jgi:WD domain, G-beta repeat
MQVSDVAHLMLSCVNRLAWSEDGTLLVSGSDDRSMRVWRYMGDGARQPLVVDTLHQGNIFGVGFLPATNNQELVSGAMDYSGGFWLTWDKLGMLQLADCAWFTACIVLPRCYGGIVKSLHPLCKSLLQTASVLSRAQSSTMSWRRARMLHSQLAAQCGMDATEPTPPAPSSPCPAAPHRTPPTRGASRSGRCHAPVNQWQLRHAICITCMIGSLT